MTQRRAVALFVSALVLSAITYLALAYMGIFGQLETAGEVTAVARPQQVITQQQQQQKTTALQAGITEPKQILFGDLHVHTTFSIDAFQSSLQLMGGEGASPPSDACDFARFCSALDFFSINDHAESLTSSKWNQTLDSIAQCNASSADASNPDLVAFSGWEWTQAGTEPGNHFGHKVVVLKSDKKEELPKRPIYAIQPLRVEREATPAQRIALPLLHFSDRQRAYDFFELTDSVAREPVCPEGVNVRDLPDNCREGATTPRELFDKLDQWGVESMVIPHGNTWGLYTPPGTSWDKQLKNDNQDSDYQFLFEVYSGHGTSEEYRDWRAVRYDEKGKPYCPEPSDDYTPSCWRAGELIEQRCLNEGLANSECTARAKTARLTYVLNGIAGHNTAVGTPFEEWLNAGQCQDCDRPAFNYRPGGSVQYALSLTNFDNEPENQRFRFGLMGSSDNHSARPGTGYKEISRYGMADIAGVQNTSTHKLIYQKQKPSAVPSDDDNMLDLGPVKRYEFERGSSFYYTGGLIATHANGRSREAIWDAMQRREVYATTGERLLLWFDMVDAQGNALHPMGSELKTGQTPRFRVTAVGAFKQKPGCPADAISDFGPDKIESVCRGECYNPSDERQQIERIEIVRVEPQMYPDEPIITAEGDSRIQNVWKSFTCPADSDSCSVTFDDDRFLEEARNVVYYARAIQAPTPKINGDTLRCEYDANGNCIRVRPCYADERTDKGDQCLAEVSSKAWSSPIFVDYLDPIQEVAHNL
ncbi:DUF3604 domain-containing protein [Kistimonas asteriae]|uniref:DUF3604 domain-containing protein n=1 Tax=Kistimonas asteriae TaxID=517724 RepID=UPI001BAD0E07|nr:DUF3604 domain-containing protein [Kistimonas asteriae]